MIGLRPKGEHSKRTCWRAWLGLERMQTAGRRKSLQHYDLILILLVGVIIGGDRDPRTRLSLPASDRAVNTSSPGESTGWFIMPARHSKILGAVARGFQTLKSVWTIQIGPSVLGATSSLALLLIFWINAYRFSLHRDLLSSCTSV